MAVEPRRRCGFRKIGGTYLVTEPGTLFECGRIPLALVPCPLCDHAPAFSRGLQKIIPRSVLHSGECAEPAAVCLLCPLGKALAAEVGALLWVGDRYYSPAEFIEEAQTLGVSRRIAAPPGEWFTPGATWVFAAHKKAISQPCPEAAHVAEGNLVPSHESCERCEGEGRLSTPAVFFAFRPARVERLVPDTMPEAERARLRKRGLTLIEVPGDDPDHQASRRNGEEEA